MASESGIVRVNKSSGNYFIASNEPFNDERLSWEARGVMGYLLSKPDGWEIKEKDLIKKGPAKLHKITRVIKELKARGYIQRYRVRRPDGTFDWVSEVFESPSANPDHKEKEPTLAELEYAFPESENEATTTRETTHGFSTNGLSTHGKSGYIVSTEGASTNRVITKTETTSHIEKPKDGFSRVSPEHPQAQQPSKRATKQVPLSSQAALFESPPSVSVEPLPSQPQVPQRQRKPDAMYDAICLAWKTEGGMAGKIQQQLLGKMPKKHPHHASNFAEPATPDEVASFAKWYKNRYPGCDMPMSPEKIQHHFAAFRRETGEAAKKNAPKIREQNGRRLKYDSTLQSWLDIGPAQVPPQSFNRSQNEAYAQ